MGTLSFHGFSQSQSLRDVHGRRDAPQAGAGERLGSPFAATWRETIAVSRAMTKIPAPNAPTKKPTGQFVKYAEAIEAHKVTSESAADNPSAT